MHKRLPRDATHSAVFAVVRRPPVCHVDVSKRPILIYYQTFSSPGGAINSSFPKGDQTVKFRRGHPQQRRQIEVGYQKFAIFNQYFRNADTEYRTDMKKYRIPIRLQIPIPTQLYTK